jgi:hypothetical protein
VRADSVAILSPAVVAGVNLGGGRDPLLQNLSRQVWAVLPKGETEVEVLHAAGQLEKDAARGVTLVE